MSSDSNEGVMLNRIMVITKFFLFSADDASFFVISFSFQLAYFRIAQLFFAIK